MRAVRLRTANRQASRSKRWDALHQAPLCASLLAVSLSVAVLPGVHAGQFDVSIEQITTGTNHHFFGYIGQSLTIPWNASGRYILGFEIDRIDRMPEPEEAATVILVDTHRDNRILSVDKTHAWNPQQGTMFYWNPLAPETQFFFNDRDVKTGKVFTVLYDIEKRRRVREYRYNDTPVGNSGVAPSGAAFLALNYGRLARLRPVTGYPGALDWSKDDPAPANDGVFMVDVRTGEKRLLVSYGQLAERLEQRMGRIETSGLFINHTLWNRRSDRIYFFVRGNWSGDDRERINRPCSIYSDGRGLTLHEIHIGGHPEWAKGNLLIGRQGKYQIFYDVDRKKVVGRLGSPEIFPKPEGDISLSPDGNWFVNGYSKGSKNYYVVYRLSDGAFVRSRPLDRGSYRGDIRIDSAPRWNRTCDAILVPGIAGNKTRQMFVIHVIPNGKSPSSKPPNSAGLRPIPSAHQSPTMTLFKRREEAMMSTTHASLFGEASAVYIAFGRSLGWTWDWHCGESVLMDTHGAGAPSAVIRR